MLLLALLCALVLSASVTAGGAASGNGNSNGNTGQGGGPPFAGGQDWVRGRILIQPRAGVSEQRLLQIVAARGGQEQGRIPGIGVRIISVPPQAEDAVIRALSRNPNIKFAERDYLFSPDEVPNDPRYNNAWHLPKIEADAAWQQTKADGIIVAILDTGIDAAHPDLQGKLVAGWNAVDRSADDISDIHGHGTRVAGTVGAATDNGIGVAAVGWNAQIMPIRVTNRSDGMASSSDMARGLTWAADNGAHVANMSYASWRHTAVANAAQYMRNRGGLVFGSAGNNGADMGYSPSPHTIVVAATTSSDNTASWSNYGDYVDIAAPGAGIQTTSRGGGYSSVSGTSFSSPVAAAVAALVLGADRDLTPAEVEQILYDSAEDLGASGWDPHYGWGRINAGRAVGMVAGTGAIDIDMEPPQVEFQSPVDGEILDGEGVVVVEIAATDNVGVTQVDFLADGQWIGTETIAPWEFVLETDHLPEGTLRLEAKAHDAAGNLGTAAIDVIIERAPVEPVDDEAPVVTITEPVAGETVEGVILVEVDAVDNVGVTHVDLHAGDRFLGTESEAPYQFIWDTEAEVEGEITLLAEAWDDAGNRGVYQVNVTVAHAPEPEPIDTEAPVVHITAPFNNTEVEGEVVIEVEATDNVGVTHVDFYAGDRWLGTDHAAPYRLTWNADAEPAGSLTLIARAHDAAGNVGSDGVGVTVVHPEPEPEPEPVPPPVVEILSPSPGASVNGSAQISVRANGGNGIASIRVGVNDKPLCNGHGESLECTWVTDDYDAGDYSVVATAEDIDGNTDIAAVSVTLAGASISTGSGSGGGSSSGVIADDNGGGGAGFPIGFVPPGRRSRGATRQ